MHESLDDIFAVIVLYKMQFRSSVSFISLLTAIESQPGALQLLLYNNSPEIEQDVSMYDQTKIIFHVINDPENPGVSKAYNRAHQIAKNNKKKWLFLLDQDTQLPENFFSVFFSERKLDVYDADRLYFPILRSKGKIISPAKYIPYRGIMQQNVQCGYQTKKLAIINSGTIIDTALFETAGGFNDKVMLDFSDISFFRRVWQYYKRGKLINAVCTQQFSGFENDSYEKTMNRFRTFNHNAITFGKEKGVSRLFLFFTVLLRAVNLSLQFKTVNFIRAIKMY
jgi:GT2 family glycosyltransferase